MSSLRPRHVNFDEVWGNLRRTVEKVITLQQLDRIVWDHNFSDIYFLCVAIPEPKSQDLYKALNECLCKHVDAVAAKLKQVPNTNLLKQYFDEWRVFHQGAIYLHNLFGYLNKQLAKERADAEAQHTFMPVPPNDLFLYKEVGSLAFDIWKTQLIAPLAEQHLVALLIEAIENDRASKIAMVDIATVRGVISSFVQVGDVFEQSHQYISPYTESGEDLATEFYRKIFEEPFLKSTAVYYRYLTNEQFGSLDPPAYMEKVIQKIDEEKDRARRFLHTSSHEKIATLCSDILVSAQMDRFNSVCKGLVQNEKASDLRNMHILLKPIPQGLNLLIREFEEYAKKSGLDLVRVSTSEPAQMVNSILSVYKKFNAMVTDVFSDDAEFASALDRALQAIVNFRDDPKQPPKVSERLNRYVDSLLRKSNKSCSDAEVDSNLTMSIVIFRYIDDKDLFQKFYSKMLSNRLILGLSSSMDLEELMISKMKEACGYEFTNKLTRMFTDVGLSRDVTEQFHAKMNEDAKKMDVASQFMVLQAGAWPLSSSQDSGEGTTGTAFVIPTELQLPLKHFETFYYEAHNGRKLSWLYHLSSVEVRLTYLDRNYQVTMTVHQYSLLSHFANRDEFKADQLSEYSGVDLPTALRCLRGFVEIGILKSDTPEVAATSIIAINLAMTNRRVKFKVPMPSPSKPQAKESEQVCNTVAQDRKYYMECTIVRIMKTRKVLKHNALIEEVIAQTKSRFTPDVAFIKKNIEALIEKMYIQRTDQNDEYQYLA